MSSLTNLVSPPFYPHQRLAISLCSYAGSKKICGKILNVFVQDLPANAAAIYVYECIQFDFYADLKGRMVDLYAQLPEIRRELQDYIENNADTNAEGELVDSDEDEDGNLRGFVVDGDDEEGDEEEEEEGDEGEEGEGDYQNGEGEGGAEGEGLYDEDEGQGEGYAGDLYDDAETDEDA